MKFPSAKHAGRRLKELREERGLSQNELAEQAEPPTTGSQINKLEQGYRRLTTDWFERLRHPLRARPEDFVTESRNGQRRGPMIPVAGYVGAGEEVFPFGDQGPIDHIPAPPGCEGSEAFIVRGDSMLPVYRDGDVLIALARYQSPRELLGRDCVVDTEDGRRLVKNVRRGGAKGTYRLFSYRTLAESDDLKLVRAAAIKWISRA